jgi:uncharacterized membrane protein (DUF2068 family)
MARTYTKKELRKAYQVSDKTFNIWLKRIPNFLPQVGAHVFSPLEVEKIFEHLGKPDTIEE